jgi:hypothetical protein
MESDMGAKASQNFQSDRPESGGADKDMLREKSGLLDRDKERVAKKQHEEEIEAHRLAPEQPHAPFSIDNPRNPDPHHK